MDAEELTVKLTLRSLKSDIPAINRLRSMLKTMLRAYDFRVELVEDVSNKKRRIDRGVIQEVRTPF